MHQRCTFFTDLMYCRAVSIVNQRLSSIGPLSHDPSNQPILVLPRTHPAYNSIFNTLLAIRYSSTVSACPNHLNTPDSLFSPAPFLPYFVNNSGLLIFIEIPVVLSFFLSYSPVIPYTLFIPIYSIIQFKITQIIFF